MSAPSLRVVVLICVFLSACATAPVGRKDLLDFLDAGVTRRDDVQLQLGEPAAQYDGQRVLAYRLVKDDAGYVIVGQRNNWLGVQYNLMLVFDADGILRRHSLVLIRSP
jgi:hypothetical protein